VRVALRTRPLVSKEINEGATDCMQFIKDAKQVILDEKKAFTFDYVFDTKSDQESVYSQAVYPLIGGIFQGYNGTVLAYGQTGSGKTFTMGSAHSVTDAGIVSKYSGVIPRVIKDLFDGIKERAEKCEFVVKVWYAEIYKEEVKDLLVRDPNAGQNLPIREFIDGSIKIAGITEVVVENPETTLQLMENGNSRRATGSTAMNKTSSRSHAIFTIVLEARSLSDPNDYTHSNFHLVDLAGSERIKRTKAEGTRLQEGIKINSGLLALGNVISALGESKDQHVPYRVSKLTRLLQMSLGGNCRTVMIACASPAKSNYEETHNTLRYADRARKIKNKAVVNRDPQTAELARLRNEVTELRLQLMSQDGGDAGSAVISPVIGNHTIMPGATDEERREIEENNQLLVEKVDQLSHTNLKNLAKIMKMEKHRCDLSSKLFELQETARSVCDSTHDLSMIEEALVQEEAQHECVKKLRELQQNVLSLKVDSMDNTTEEVNMMDFDHTADVNGNVTSHSLDCSAGSIKDLNMTEVEKQKHVINSANLAAQLEELSKAISLKEDVKRKYEVSNSAEMLEMKNKFEVIVKNLDEQINKLSNEKTTLEIALETTKVSKDSKKISDQRRIQIKELEAKIKDLQAQKKEKEKLAKLKTQSDKKIVKLSDDITGLKSARAQLMRKMKEGNQKFAQFRKDKDKEVKQLHKKDRKRQVELSKMQIMQKKQSNVLHRKNEECASALRRLNQVLMKQKHSSQRRTANQSKRVENETLKWKEVISNELEVRVQVQVAKKCQKNLEEQVNQLKKNLKKLENDISTTPKQKTPAYVAEL